MQKSAAGLQQPQIFMKLQRLLLQNSQQLLLLHQCLSSLLL
jgi:hypothetical protein